MTVKELFDILNSIPINNRAHLSKPFLHFPEGTQIEYVWKWFADTFPVPLYPLFDHED